MKERSRIHRFSFQEICICSHVRCSCGRDFCCLGYKGHAQNDGRDDAEYDGQDGGRRLQPGGDVTENDGDFGEARQRRQLVLAGKISSYGEC